MKIKIAFLFLLWLAFSAVGLMMHASCRNAPRNDLGWTDIAGYDSEGYVTHYTSPVGLMEVNHRHPLMALAAAPVTVVGLIVSFRAGREIGCDAVIVCFALIGALTCGLLYLTMKKAGANRLTRTAALLLWLSFAHVWILAGIAELFSISMAILLGVLLMVLYEVRNVRAWLGASVLAGGVTVTNFVKPMTAWLVAGDGLHFWRRLRLRTVLIAAGAIAGGLIAVTLCVTVKWIFVDGLSFAEGVSTTLGEVTNFLPMGVSVSRRLWLTWNAFWCEPLMIRESVIGKSAILHPYATVVPHILAAAVLLLCVWSAIRNRRLPVVRAALSMVLFDFLLHVVIGWGIGEGEIYCGHWFWIIPLLIALLPHRAAPAIFLLAAGIAAQNLTLVFG